MSSFLSALSFIQKAYSSVNNFVSRTMPKAKGGF